MSFDRCVHPGDLSVAVEEFASSRASCVQLGVRLLALSVVFLSFVPESVCINSCVFFVTVEYFIVGPWYSLFIPAQRLDGE